MCSPSAASGSSASSAASVALSRLLERGLRDSKAVDTEGLCVLVGRYVWAVRLDVRLLDDGGAAADACALAAAAALLTARVPQVRALKGLAGSLSLSLARSWWMRGRLGEARPRGSCGVRPSSLSDLTSASLVVPFFATTMMAKRICAQATVAAEEEGIGGGGGGGGGSRPAGTTARGVAASGSGEGVAGTAQVEAAPTVIIHSPEARLSRVDRALHRKSGPFVGLISFSGAIGRGLARWALLFPAPHLPAPR